ncbi:acyl-CoA dehydrogenase [Suttonella ornithocola]|uniref:Acyl-coenzyme A dehydrogenase n=1 Tax=Suttonella ornithocola TaxID=279832 RepID=A0A380MWH5_9GAMM|nr:acyl-CoA dehydrogenase [Suttonella ornithocola]SUO96919.1 Acyl-CoA dehydrogenase, short-chain specific [Suttonella ornithocola]
MWLVVLLFILFGLLVLAYLSPPAWGWIIGLFVIGIFVHSPLWLIIAGIAIVYACHSKAIREKLISRPLFGFFKKVLPTLSDTEQAAIDAGTVWWDAEVFNGKPDWKKLENYPSPQLSKEEQDFLDGPVEEICAMLNDWDVVHKYRDLPPEVWDKIRSSGILAMIIKKKYGGLEFSNYAHAKVVGKIATRCGTAATMVMVPNSLGPGELLQHYGTKEQCEYYLPRLAKGIDIPCFALTSPYAGSDAGAIPDTGIVCKGSYTDPRDGSHHKDVIGIRVSFEKRWMTLGPIATVFGLAFKLYDPDHLIGDKENIGITCALLPKGTEGLYHERRHYPNNSPFMNGPIWGKDVFIPLDWIIGGREYAGQGWRMLMECLSVGRCISLPALSVAAGKAATYTTSAWAGIRHQFGLPIGRFEGVDEALARIGGLTYQMEAAQDLALIGLDMGEKPSVISAILKYHNTERMRQTINDAMDIHGGRAVVTGPRNYLASAYNAIPVAITVEGANILTRSMMIFGQGAFRCHNYVLNEINAVSKNNIDAFDSALAGHIRQSLRNVAGSFLLGITNGAFSSVPANAGALAVYYRRINRLSAAFAAAADISMLSLGGALKFREKLSARLGDVFSNLYIASAVLKHYQVQEKPKEDLPLVKYAVEKALFDAENALDGLVKNIPNKAVRIFLRVITLPLGCRNSTPSDKLGTAVARTMMDFDGSLKRLTQFIYVPKNVAVDDVNEPLAVLEPALQAIREAAPSEKVIRMAERSGKLTAFSPQDRVQEAVEKSLISQEEADKVMQARRLMRIAITVDDFDMQLNEHEKNLFDRVIYLA